MNQGEIFKIESKYTMDMNTLLYLFGAEERAKYPKDVFVGLHEKIMELFNNGYLVSHETVFEEIDKGEVIKDGKKCPDELKIWARANKHIFLPFDELNEIEVVREINSRKDCEGFVNKVNSDNSQADHFILAQAKCRNLGIINYEKDNSTVRIPHVARLLNIESIDLVSLSRKLQWQFR